MSTFLTPRLKDESGIVGYDSRVPFARRIGAVEPSYELRKAVAEIHSLGGRVVMAGKPFGPIYDLALKEAGRLLEGRLDRARVLCVGDGVVTEASVAFISVGPVPLVLDLTEALQGTPASAIDPADVYDHVVAQVHPREDIHATADYRRHLAGVTAARAVATGAERAASVEVAA